MKLDRFGFIPYNWIVNTYQLSGQIEVLEKCNGLSFTNIGNTSVTINGKTLFPGTVGSVLGDSFTIGGNMGEILNERRVTIAFGAGTTPNLEIVQKYYL